MSTHDLKKTLTKELENLNDIIDRKIIKGLPYAKEARRHKFIVHSLAQISVEKAARSTWFSRGVRLPFSFSSSF